MKNKLVVSPSPHIHSGDTIEKNMYGVLIALVPAFLVSLYVFGLAAFVLTLASVLFCIITEYVAQRFMLKKEPTILDGSAVITGVLLAFNVPSNLPLWILAIGAIVAIGVGKISFGGLGNNIFNPALLGRVFLLISFPAQMTTWPIASTMDVVDGHTAATVLQELKGISLGFVDETSKTFPTIHNMFFGLEKGSIGEMSAMALLLGMVYLLWRKIITWHIPVSILLTVAVFAGGMYLIDPSPAHNPLIHLLSGGLMLGAVFMATDYATSPLSHKGMIIYGVGIGVITMCIRLWGSYPEGVSFAILLMNAFTPLINNYVKPKRFGEVVKNG